MIFIKLRTSAPGWIFNTLSCTKKEKLSNLCKFRKNVQDRPLNGISTSMVGKGKRRSGGGGAEEGEGSVGFGLCV